MFEDIAIEQLNAHLQQKRALEAKYKLQVLNDIRELNGGKIPKSLRDSVGSSSYDNLLQYYFHNYALTAILVYSRQ